MPDVPTTSGLEPNFRRVVDAWIEFLRAHDSRFVITSAKRTRAEQQRLYNRWLSGESPFPALAPGNSQHERGFAVDIVRLGVDPAEDELLAQAGAAWRSFGAVWGGEKDPVHFEAPKSWTGRS